MTSVVEVQGDAALLQSENSSVGGVIDRKKIVELPLNGRNLVTLALLVPGVNTGQPGAGRGGGIFIGGMRSEQNSLQLLMTTFKQQSLIALSAILLVIVSLSGSAASGWQAGGKSKLSPIKLVYPNGLALDDKGDLYISDTGTHRVLKLNRQGRLIVVAGTGEGGYSGDGGAAIKAQLHAPHDLIFDAEGNLFVADTYNHRIRRIDRQGVITTVAGIGKAPYAGYGNPAPKDTLNNPQGIAVDRDGTLLIADTYNRVVRRLEGNGTLTVIAGSVAGLSGDGGPATEAQLNLPMAVTVGPDGSVYVNDAVNSRVRRITADGKIQTVAGFGGGEGIGGAGFAGDGGPAEKAKLFSPADLKFDTAGNLYLSDSGNNRIRLIRGGIITTIAGSGRAGFSGDGNPATAAELNTPQKIAIAKDGSIFIADRANHRVRKVDARGFITTVAGEGKPSGMVFDPEVIR